MLGSNLACPPCNIGPRSTPNYQARSRTRRSNSVERRDVSPASATRAFFVDLGSIFDLGDAAAVPEPAPDPDGPAIGRRRAGDAQRALDRDPGADPGSDARRLDPDRPDGRRRCSGSGARRAAARRGCSTRPRTSAPSPGRGCRCPGSATRCSTRSSCRWARRTSGTRWTRRRTRSSPSTSSTPSSRSCCRCCTRACSRTSRR